MTARMGPSRKYLHVSFCLISVCWLIDWLNRKERKDKRGGKRERVQLTTDRTARE